MGKKALAFLLILAINISVVSAGETVIKPGEMLDLERCIDIALKVHPSMMGSLYAVKAREAQLGQARAAYFPKLDTSAGFLRNFSINNTYDPVFGGLYLNQYNRNLGTASLNQTIYDFGRTSSRPHVNGIACGLFFIVIMFLRIYAVFAYTSKSPYKVILNVRGIGVADINKVCGKISNSV